MPERNASPSLVPISFWTTSLTNSTASAVPAAIRALNPRAMCISVETQPARFRTDSTAPTLTTGVVIPKDLAPFLFTGYNGSANFKFQRTTGTCKLSVQFFKYVGD